MAAARATAASVARRDARTVLLTRGVYAVLDGRFVDTVVDRDAGWFLRHSPHDHEVRPSRRRPVTFVPSVYVPGSTSA